MRLVSTALGILLLATSVNAATVYVKKTATGANNGTSWTDAFTDLRAALLVATSSDEIWVAADTYTPTSSIDRSFSFQLVSGVGVYGGFNGTETLRDQRNPATNVTILSGDIGVALDPSDNSYHVVNASGTDATAVIDGFTIIDGNADGSSPNNLGGGLYCDPGGPTMANLVFANNSAANGGGLCSRNGDVTLTNCVFSNNNSTGYGGGVSLVLGTIRLTNLTIVGNTATTGGGGISGVSVTLDVANTILADNAAPDGPESRVLNSTVTWSHSLVRGSGGTQMWDPAFGADAGGNIDAKPWLVDVASGDVRPLLRSQVVEAGDNSVPGLPSLDLDWNPRIAGNSVDMGAYELSPGCPAGPVVYVKLEAAGAGDGTSWTDAFTELHSALNLAEICPSVSEIWVAAGDYPIQDGTERSVSYRLISGVSIYGGFSGTETMRDQRDWLANLTSLTGDAPNWTQSAHQVVRAVDVDNTAILDGFWIERALGMPGINGGGLYVENASPVVANVRFDNNYSADYGGGIYVASGSPTLYNAWFINNLVSETGRAIYVAGGSLTLSSAYIPTSSSGDHEAVVIAGGSANLINVTMRRNGGITNDGATLNLTNSIIWGQEDTFVGILNLNGGNTTVSHSLVTGSLAPGSWNPAVGTNGGGNLDADPLFVSKFDPRLSTGSPAINAGDNAASPLPPIDLDMNARTADGIVDMGGWEWQGNCPTATRFYVDENAVGAGDGTSWADAFTELRDALLNACSNIGEIWVAQGVYTPSDDDRMVGLRLRSGLAIYGGFTGTETSLGQRDFLSNVTVLSGEIGTPSLDDNSQRIVWGTYNDATAVLDGFTLSGSWGTSSIASAIQMEYSDTQFRNLIVTGNHNLSSSPAGAGMYAAWGDYTISDVTFVGNDGGALFINRGSPTVTNVAFEHNISGPAVFMYETTALLRNLIFFENSNRALYHSYGAVPTIVNATIVGTITGGNEPAAVFNRHSSDAAIWNSIIWGTSGPTVHTKSTSDAIFHHSIIEGCGGSSAWNNAYGIDGGGNLDTDPLLADTTGGNLMLRYNSPAINAGSNLAPGMYGTDIAGNIRIYGGVVDMGAYEYAAPVSVETPARRLSLDTAYPNPFNPSLTVEFSLDRARSVRVDVFNVRGALVRTLVDDARPAGPQRVQWDGTDNAGTRVASGVYLIRVSSEGWKAHRKVLMLK